MATGEANSEQAGRTVKVRAHRKQLLHCARDDGREGSTQQRKTHAARPRPIQHLCSSAVFLCRCRPVLLLPPVRPVCLFVCRLESGTCAKRTLLMRYKFQVDTLYSRSLHHCHSLTIKEKHCASFTNESEGMLLS